MYFIFAYSSKIKLSDYQNALESLFSGKQVRITAVWRGHVGPVEHHVDEGDEDGGGAPLGEVECVGVLVGVVLGPLDEHEEGEVTEDAAEEDHLRDELRQYVKIFSTREILTFRLLLHFPHFRIAYLAYYKQYGKLF